MFFAACFHSLFALQLPEEPYSFISTSLKYLKASLLLLILHSQLNKQAPSASLCISSVCFGLLGYIYWCKILLAEMDSLAIPVSVVTNIQASFTLEILPFR